MVAKEFPVIRISAGSAGERGVQYGRAQPALIRDCLDKTYHYWRAVHGLSRHECLAQSERFMPYVQEIGPDLIEEMAGIADGAGLTPEDIFFLNYFVDMKYQSSRVPADHAFASACTTYCAVGKATADGGVYVGQNNDFRAAYQDDMVVLVEDLGSVRSGMVTYAGMVGESGLNSAGIAAVANGLSSSDAGDGVPFIILMRKILEQERVGDALSVVLGAKRASGTNYVIGSASGDIFHIECGSSDFDILYPNQGIIGHSNHFTSPRLRHLDRSHARGTGGNTVLRLSRINRQLESTRGNIDLDTMMQFGRDHVDYPRSVCKHVSDEDAPLEAGKTLYGLILEAAKRNMHVAAGNPCENEYVEYPI
jgi:isopenicillin-N N-acyltransferase-like protein